MGTETDPKTAWQKTKDWVSNNRVATGAAAGAAAGVGLGGVGVIPGVIVGAAVGWWSKKEAERVEGK